MVKVTVHGMEIQIRRFGNIRGAINNFQPLWPAITAYMQSVISLQFSDNAKGRKKVRGKYWPWFAPQYTRSDGTVVPAEGGIARLDGKGMVLGRLRDSTRQRVSPESNLMRNTGIMFGGLLNNPIMRDDELIMRSTGNQEQISYQNSLRPFLFFQKSRDPNMIKQIILRNLQQVINE